jgi:hypothetical protein
MGEAVAVGHGCRHGARTVQHLCPQTKEVRPPPVKRAGLGRGWA